MQLDKEEAQMFMDELSMKESGLSRIIKTGYRILNYITFAAIKNPQIKTKSTSRYNSFTSFFSQRGQPTINQQTSSATQFQQNTLNPQDNVQNEFAEKEQPKTTIYQNSRNNFANNQNIDIPTFYRKNTTINK